MDIGGHSSPSMTDQSTPCVQGQEQVPNLHWYFFFRRDKWVCSGHGLIAINKRDEWQSFSDLSTHRPDNEKYLLKVVQMMDEGLSFMKGVRKGTEIAVSNGYFQDPVGPVSVFLVGQDPSI